MKLKLAFTVLLGTIIILFSCKTKNVNKMDPKTYVETQYKELKKDLPEAQVTILNDTIKVLFPNNLLFKTAESTLNDNVNPLMERFANSLNKFTKTSVMVSGHTDNVGSASSNQTLSQNRADNTRLKLIDYKVSESRLHAWGHGDTMPLVENTSDENKALNRRVEFIIMLDYKQFKKK